MHGFHGYWKLLNSSHLVSLFSFSSLFKKKNRQIVTPFQGNWPIQELPDVVPWQSFSISVKTWYHVYSLTFTCFDAISLPPSLVRYYYLLMI